MRRTCEEDRLLFSLEEVKDDEVIERDRLRSRPRLVRARALLAAVVSGDGDSPNMKNLINAPMMITTDSWPRRKPSVNDNLRLFSCLALSRQNTVNLPRVLRKLQRRIGCSIISHVKIMEAKRWKLFAAPKS